MASILRVNTLTDASSNNSIATSFVASGCAKVWVFADQNVIDDSLKTSSSTDVGTGEYTFTFTSNLTSTDYCTTACVNENANNIIGRKANTTSSKTIRSKDASNSGQDGDTGSSSFGDLA